MKTGSDKLGAISRLTGMAGICGDAVVEYESGKRLCFSALDTLRVEEADGSVSAAAEIPGYSVRLTVQRLEADVFSLRAALAPKKDLGDKAHRITTACITAPYSKDTRIYVNHPFKEGIHPVETLPEDCSSRDFCSFYQKDRPGAAVTFTSALPAKFRYDIAVSKNGDTFTVSLSTTVPYSFEGEILCQEWILYTNMPTATALAKNAGRYASDQPFHAPIGWSTWDYYFTSATEEDVKENVDFIASDPALSKAVRYIALDDGWQQREGDWRSGIRYPGGLKALVDYIRARGFEAGIWIAPTRLHFLCGTVMRRHAFLVRDPYGDPVADGDMYILDPTHPDGEQFLRETFGYLADCGFTFYKLDFISNLLTHAQRFYDKQAGPFDALARLFAIVRETVPEGSHIMGCSLPYGMGAGFADSRRTGWDIHNTWGHVKACVATYLPQFASNGVIYRNDLDYLVVRGGETSEDPATNVINPKQGYYAAHPKDGFVWRAGADFSYREAKTWCAIMLMSGSSIFLGDRLPLLNEKGLALVRKTVAAADFRAATPVFGAEPIPEVWYKRHPGWLYVFNFTEEKKDYAIPLAELVPGSCERLTDLFTGLSYTPRDGILFLSLDAHDSVSLKIT